MTSQPQTLWQNFTQAVQTLHASVNFSKLGLKPGARVPELQIREEESKEPRVYPLLGENYRLGRSSRSCEIVVRNPVVSHTHLSLTREQRPGAPFILRDENSTNGIYFGRRRIQEIELQHGDTLTLGPPALKAAVQIRYLDPPSWPMRVLRYSTYGLGSLTALVSLWVGLEWQKISVQPLPVSVQGPVIIYARDQTTPLRALNNQSHRELRRLSEFSPHLPQAVIASEDSRFYWHLGIDPIGIVRALVANIRGGTILEGGSTLSQQLARNIFRDYVGTQDSAGRKLREAVVALKLETIYSKDSLLRTYLNQVYLGSGNYGFEDAAQFYFGKSARDLTLSEAATLAGILPAPNSFNPVQDYETAIALRDRILKRMSLLGMITQEEASRARRSRIEINPKAREVLQGTIAPYFYTHVFNELQQLLGEQLAEEGNFIIETGLDLHMQKRAEQSLRQAVNREGTAYGFTQGALVAFNASTGAIQALVGGVDFRSSQFNRATQALRQPGSTFKIFAYTAALERGTSPGAHYSCAPLTWRGQSFAGCRTASGRLDMATGLAYSENVIALRIGQDVGLGTVMQTAQRMGIASELAPVPGLVLGQSEVTLLELTGAFGVLANEGLRNRPHAIERILDSSDCSDPDDLSTCRVIYDYDQSLEANFPVLKTETAWQMTDMLQGVVRYGTGRNAQMGRGEAGKTGTTNDNIDLWFVGYVPNRKLVAGVWFGNDDNTPTAGSSSQAAKLWGDYMGQILP